MRRNKDHPLHEVSRALARIEDAALIDRFLESILTAREVRDLARRWELVKLLDRGSSQRSIARTLGMSLCKITRGSRELKKPGSALRRVLETNAASAGSVASVESPANR
jgi:TrpR family transcriptional regulator, trp operon repressor